MLNPVLTVDGMTASGQRRLQLLCRELARPLYHHNYSLLPFDTDLVDWFCSRLTSSIKTRLFDDGVSPDIGILVNYDGREGPDVC